ncbi:MAG: hypothetical protein H7Y86_01840, partial [Rhizobacter sp.]|nr:hypothetical protein [Ferruginibacter sp.]
MKTKKMLSAFLICLGIFPFPTFAQQIDSDSTRLPGANFSLEGALELFKKASSPEEFEKLLNAEENKVNNLDLNDDGTTDYIKVINRLEKDVQIFVLQAAISPFENQDIAVIELEKNGAGSATIQIVGDEDLYGEETIVEPYDDATTATNIYPNAGYNAYNDDILSATHGPHASLDYNSENIESPASFKSSDAIIIN